MKPKLKSVCCLTIILLLTCLNASAGLNDGLQAYYKLDGNAIDETGNHNGTSYGTTWIKGVDGSAASFDGINDYIEMGVTRDILNSPLVSFSFWFRTATPSQPSSFFASYDGGFLENGNLLIRHDENGNLNIQYGTGSLGQGHNRTFATAFEANNWYHMALVLDTTQVDVADRSRLFLNGTEILTSVFNASDTSSLGVSIGDSSDIFRMAAFLDTDTVLPNRYGKGQIDELRIYNRGLTSEEIATLAVPEPASAMMIALGSLLITGYRRIRKSYGL